MKTLVISDCHLNDDFLIFQKILFPILQQIIDKYKIDKIIFLGDIFDSSSLTNTVLFLFKKLITMFVDYDIEIIVGNHDLIDKRTSAFDILLLGDNIKIVNRLTFRGQYIYIPYINNKEDFVSTFAEINDHMKNSEHTEFFIYSHNDFSSLYKFRNTFFNLEGAFADINKPLYFINGHNHVPFFRDRHPLYIANLGCVINLNFKDSGEFNNFLIVDDEADNINDKLKIIQNGYSIQYYTFKIKSEQEIYDHLNTLNTDNVKYVTFKAIAPNINIDNELRLKLQKKFNIININMVQELSMTTFDPKNIDVENPDDISDIHSILDKYGITISEFLEHNSIEAFEKTEILYTLLEIMFEDIGLEQDDRDKIVKTVNKHYLIYDKI